MMEQERSQPFIIDRGVRINQFIKGIEQDKYHKLEYCQQYKNITVEHVIQIEQDLCKN